MSAISNPLLSNTNNGIVVNIPQRQLLKGSLHVTDTRKQFNAWTAEDHGQSFDYLRKIALVWKEKGINQYLIYGKIDNSTFHWEIVPYEKCRTTVGRIVQQIVVLWRTVFGGFVVSEESKNRQFNNYQHLSEIEIRQTEEQPSIHTDPFCKPEIIQRQKVFEGKEVNVLFSHAPIGFGGERLHFLIVPHNHREKFTDLTKEEYCESLELTRKLVVHFNESKVAKNVYLLNKTGRDAGQSVPHCHLHVVLANPAQDFWGKLTVFKNILFGSSVMKSAEFEKRVAVLRTELSSL